MRPNRARFFVSNLLNSTGAAGVQLTEFGGVMKSRVALLTLGLVAGAAGQIAAQTPGPGGAVAQDLLSRYCITCHSQRTKAGSLVLEGAALARVGESGAMWEKVVRKLRGRLMPPSGMPRPDDRTYDAFTSWIETQLDAHAATHPNPGRTETFRRLNRTQYQNAVRDLLALDVDVSRMVPADDSAAGFDNIGGVFKLSATLMESYLSAAKKIAERAMGTLPSVVDEGARYSARGQQQHDWIEGNGLGTRGGLVVRHLFPQNGEYTFKIEAGDEYFASDVFTLELTLDGAQVKTFEVKALTTFRENFSVKRENDFRVRIPVAAGSHDVGVAFYRTAPAQPDYILRPYHIGMSNPIAGANAGPGGDQPTVAALLIGGPFKPTGPGDTPSRRRILTCRPATPEQETSCARTNLSALARRAYRRPVTDADVAPLMEVYADRRTRGGDFEAGIEMALRRVLTSPAFLFHIEAAPARATAGQNAYRISDLELASRVSFLLWSSIPDDRLLDAAVQGRLNDPKVLEREVRRMLTDPRSEALTSSFASQWLQLRKLDSSRPGANYAQIVDGSLRRALRRETELFFDSLVRENRPVTSLLTADYTFLNERLADHYGIKGVQGSHFRRVSLPADSPRRGVLGQGSILMLTSQAIRTSPVFRGKYVLDTLLGVPPPEPPPDVPSLPESKEGAAPQTMRERMAKHRSNPVCASCHSMIDPLGFGLENFDPVGRWRDVDEGLLPVDASGMLPDGRKFGGLTELRSLLTEHPRQIATTLAEKLLTFALGRELEYYDMPTVRTVVRTAAKQDYRFQSIVLGIVNSDAFRMRSVGERQ
jgi:mono/diheme cytochrome c family protein